MRRTIKRAVALLLTCAAAAALTVATPASAARADSEDGVPSFRKSKDKDTQEFVERVFTAIVKAARLKTKNHAVEKYQYVLEKDKDNRKVLKIQGHYDGATVQKKVETTIEIKIDTSNEKAWEVLNVDYKDKNKSILGPNTTKIQALIKEFNK